MLNISASERFLAEVRFTLGGDAHGKILILAYITVAVCLDLKSEMIPNSWIFIGWSIGFIFQLQQGAKHISSFLLGASLPVLLLFLLFATRMLGAGDIKLFSVLGGLMGPLAVFKCILYSFLCGAILSVAILIFCGDLIIRLQYFLNYLQCYLKYKQRIPYRLNGKNRLEHLHFSVAILMGALLWIGGIY